MSELRACKRCGSKATVLMSGECLKCFAATVSTEHLLSSSILIPEIKRELQGRFDGLLAALELCDETLKPFSFHLPDGRVLADVITAAVAKAKGGSPR